MNPSGDTSRAVRNSLLAVLLLGGLALAVGWRVFWFLTDDAYIAFRYISNAHLGHGYVWNAPPFLPVEGYTSFLWILLLDIVWRILGVEPPASANWLTLGFSYLSLLLAAVMIMRIQWHGRLERYRVAAVGALILFLTLNRTFLAWSSSGLETAMMDFFLILWVYVILYSASPFRRAFLGALTAALLTLTRPDGLLFCAATMVVVCLLALAERDKKRRHRVLLYGCLPFGIVLLHQAWRLRLYGEWLPNTYYAKVTSSWPQSGFLYLLSFMLEYGLWFAVAFICWAVIKGVAGMLPPGAEHPVPGQRHSLLANVDGQAGVALVVVGTLILHVGYYTYLVGGDHFEYRVYAHLLPLVFVALIWSLNRLSMKPLPALSVVLAFILLSMPVPWTHWALSRDLDTRELTHGMIVPIAPSWPWMVRWYADGFDAMQSWLIRHHVCMRHQEHKVFWQAQVNENISREQGLQMSREDDPLLAAWSIGVPGWVMPHVYIIDGLGLNDYVIARTPAPDDSVRTMAHSRRPPAGYVESYQPNVEIREGEVIIGKRLQALTRESISANERYWRDWLQINVQSGPAGAEETAH